jgi:predicted DNA-binding transcriptional regulator AlpA
MSEPNGELLISLGEAGRMLGGISVKTVRRRIAEGLLPKPIKEGKFSRLLRSDVAGLIENLKRKRDEKSAAAVRGTRVGEGTSDRLRNK